LVKINSVLVRVHGALSGVVQVAHPLIPGDRVQAFLDRNWYGGFSPKVHILLNGCDTPCDVSLCKGDVLDLIPRMVKDNVDLQKTRWVPVRVLIPGREIHTRYVPNKVPLLDVLDWINPDWQVSWDTNLNGKPVCPDTPVSENDYIALIPKLQAGFDPSKVNIPAQLRLLGKLLSDCSNEDIFEPPTAVKALCRLLGGLGSNSEYLGIWTVRNKDGSLVYVKVMSGVAAWVFMTTPLKGRIRGSLLDADFYRDKAGWQEHSHLAATRQKVIQDIISKPM
jgi:hypothetical protein